MSSCKGETGQRTPLRLRMRLASERNTAYPLLLQLQPSFLLSTSRTQQSTLFRRILLRSALPLLVKESRARTAHLAIYTGLRLPLNPLDCSCCPTSQSRGDEAHSRVR
jgi:hypothetical protein